ncbi:class I SAM-dependent methyltransferase [Lacibacter sediminis]|uniref:Methyltransferase domain-containing protein n=1 Tax=Lacibacter sediminis TaxID=2760713 RepID=A0A7G5XJ08_9BACT|nr:methyltransferase domain-containing protein [Lacibacter sediminis]QNA45461.1 methyltransferase domain-containing protein [Lacibacter sediminis]
MELQPSLKTFHFGDYRFNAFVPDSSALQQAFTKQLQTDPSTPAPYWAQVWPSAYALCEFIATQPHWLQNKTVLELAAGLGLPSLLAAQHATKVTCSDYVPEAVEFMQESIQENKLENSKAMMIDWNHLPNDLSVDVLLLSDINYEPKAFETLFNVIISFLEKGTTILLSTPQRLMAKPFIDRLLPYIKLWEEQTITNVTPAVTCSVYVLQQ